jgi:predicted MFS family arabinose efflux permease
MNIAETDPTGSPRTSPGQVTAGPRMTRPLTWLFAVAGGAAVGNLYYVQPLLDLIAHSLHTGQATAGLLVTATQLGYAAGIFFIVPLGDIRDRRRLIPAIMGISVVALAGCAAAPNIVVLAAAMAAVGVTTVAGQILTPFAGDLSDDASRGRVVGIVVSGLLTGILVARVLSGLVGGTVGWRMVFVLAAALMAALAVLLYRALPVVPAKASMPYSSLLRSVTAIVRRERPLQIIMVFGMVSFATFTLFWTALTFLLSGAPYHYSATVIGLFGLVGLVGSLAAQGAGRLHDRGWSNTASGLAWLLALSAWAASALGSDSLPWLLAAVLILDIATQSQRILNQAQIFTISAEARSRINTAYVTGNFLGGAAGSIGASILWSLGGWNAIVLTGGSLCLLALGLWSVTRATLRRLSSPGLGRR